MALANFKGTHTPMYHGFEKVEKGRIMKLLDSISKLMSNIDIPEMRVMESSADMTL